MDLLRAAIENLESKRPTSGELHTCVTHEQFYEKICKVSVEDLGLDKYSHHSIARYSAVSNSNDFIVRYSIRT